MTWLKLKVKEWGWKIALITVMTALVGYYLYRLLKPAAPISPQVDKIVTQLEIAVKESELETRLEKEKIKAIKTVYTKTLEESKNIEDRKARLERLIQIKKELSP
tara:strand:+ start:496 stop:810 length:315 start_codon:yes stop_codon:yes gene_type:complete